MAFLGQEEQLRDFQGRFKYLYAILSLSFLILICRLAFLQIFQGEKMRLYSDENRIKRVRIPAPRGMIFDKNHTLLIDNRPAFDLQVIPQYLFESGQKEMILKKLAFILKIPVIQIQTLLNKAKNQPSFLPVKIKTDLTRNEVAQIEVRKLDMPGVEVREEIKRTNVFGEIAAHLLGYIGEINLNELPILNKKGLKYRLGDSIGRYGLEQQLENILRGFDGEELKEVDALGRVKVDKNKNRLLDQLTTKPAIPGKNLVLTIDQDVQLAASEAFGDKIGAVVAMNPQTGEVLAMLSRPSFDPTAFSRGIPSKLWNKLINDENHPMRDKTIQDHYSPGSPFKIVTAIAGLEEGVIDESTVFHCPGKIKIGNRVYHCHSKNGHGEINLVRAIIQSCDVFFYRTALKLKSVDEIAKWAFELGLGKKTGIQLSTEVPGLIPTEEWKQNRLGQIWNMGETATVAIGQSFVLTNILQLANMYSALANGGKIFKPYVVKQIESSEGQLLKEFSPELVHTLKLKPKTIQLIQEGLWGVVNSPIGTAYSQRIPGIDFVGKTGTTQVIRLSADKIFQRCELKKFKDRHNAMFVGFAPLKDPKIAVAVIGEHACHGATAAGPVAKAIIKSYLEKILPDQYGPTVLAKKLKQEPIKKTVEPISTENIEDESVIIDDSWNPPSEVTPNTEQPQAPALTIE